MCDNSNVIFKPRTCDSEPRGPPHKLASAVITDSRDWGEVILCWGIGAGKNSSSDSCAASEAGVAQIPISEEVFTQTSELPDLVLPIVIIFIIASLYFRGIVLDSFFT